MRLACVEVPELPLQLLYREHPGWRERPAVVLEADRASAKVSFVSEEARRKGVLPGMRYAAALSLCAGLEAGVVSPSRVREAVLALAGQLQALSPSVEPSGDEPGIFWLDASGLLPLYPSLGDWGRALLAGVARAGFSARVVVGFGRMGSYALVRSGAPTLRILSGPEEERRRMQAVPLHRLGIEPKLRDALARLGVTTLGELVALPGGGLRGRFGERAHRLHRLASEELQLPLTPHRPVEPVRAELALEHGEADRHRLLFALKGRLDLLLKALDDRREALVLLRVELGHEDGQVSRLTIRPAAPTLDGPQLADLLRLRLERASLAPAIVEARLEAASVRPTIRQPLLFARRERRDREAATRALFRLRAELGDEAVVFPALASAHLPEGQVRWVEGGELPEARPLPPDRPRLVRRFHARSRPLPGRCAPLQPGVRLAGGPYLVSGGWWRREVERHYHFVESREGALLWIYYDGIRRRWRLQGRVD
ncbi:MAG: DNA polymerase Y family protein [Deltaproteobacteria bacterium]|nr:DNA polymerase Y family protein [Deltaproteobacteria bacterium]